MANFGPPTPLAQSDLLDVLNRNFEAHWIVGLLADPTSSSLFIGAIASLLRVQAAIDENLSVGTFILSAHGRAHAASTIQIQRPSGSAVTLPVSFRILDNRGALWFPQAAVAIPSSVGVQTVSVPIRTDRYGYFLNSFLPLTYQFQDNISTVDPNFVILPATVPASGGTSPFLDQHGKERAISRADGETDDQYRHRMLQIPEKISPFALSQAIVAVFDAFPTTKFLVDLIQKSGYRPGREPFHDSAQDALLAWEGVAQPFADFDYADDSAQGVVTVTAAVASTNYTVTIYGVAETVNSGPAPTLASIAALIAGAVNGDPLLAGRVFAYLSGSTVTVVARFLGPAFTISVGANLSLAYYGGAGPSDRDYTDFQGFFDVLIPTIPDPSEARMFADDLVDGFADDPSFGFPDTPPGSAITAPIAALADELNRRRAGGVMFRVIEGVNIDLMRHPPAGSLSQVGDWLNQAGLATDAALTGSLAFFSGDDFFVKSGQGRGAAAGISAGDLLFLLPAINQAPLSVQYVVLRAWIRQSTSNVGVAPTFAFVIKPTTAGAAQRVLTDSFPTTPTFAAAYQEIVAILEQNPISGAPWSLADIAGAFGVGVANTGTVGATDTLQVADLTCDIVASYG